MEAQHRCQHFDTTCLAVVCHVIICCKLFIVLALAGYCGGVKSRAGVCRSVPKPSVSRRFMRNLSFLRQCDSNAAGGFNSLKRAGDDLFGARPVFG